MIFKKSLTALCLAGAAMAMSGCDREIEDEVFYFVLPDRFENGDVTNDTGGIAGGKAEHGFDAEDKSYYHGGDIQGLIAKLPYLKKMGITSIWLTPIFKNEAAVGNSAGYHGYWTLDYSQIDPHWGSNADLQELVETSHDMKLKVFFDIVINHTADVIRFEECHNPDGSLLDGLDTCAYRSVEESVDNPLTPFIPAGMENAKVPAWLNDLSLYHNQGDSTFSGENSYNGDFFGLDDLKTEDPRVVDGMVEIFKFWISEFQIDGFRVDTVKHVNLDFWQQWTPQILEHAESVGIDDFFIFGEVFEGHPKTLSEYTTTGKIPSVLDFGLYYAIKDVVASSQGTERLDWVFSFDDYYTDADSSAAQLMNFASNHDVGRIAYHIEQSNPTISDEEKLARIKLSNAIMFFGRGIPVVYYGDEQGFVGDGGDADAREDMMPSQVESFNDNVLVGTDKTTADDNFDTKHPLFLDIKAKSKLLKQHKALRRGVQFVRHSSPEAGIFALSRVLPDENIEYLVVMNSADEEQSVSLDAASSEYRLIYPKGRDTIAADSEQKVDLVLAPFEVRVYRAKQKLPEANVLPEIAMSLPAEGALVSYRTEVNANLVVPEEATNALYKVVFEVSVDGGEFEFIGADSTADYRVFYDVSALADGTPLTFRSTVTNTSGETASAEVNAEVGVVPGMVMYFQKPEAWAAANIYYWSADPQPGVEWPGAAMEALGDGWYQYQFVDGVTSANIIFNDGAGQQTTNLYREGTGCYVNEQWQDSCVLPQPGLKFHFKKPDSWGDDVHMHYWDAAPADNSSWPGVAMEAIGDGWYQLQMPNNVVSANLIFNDNAGQQTANLYHDVDGCYVETDWIEDCVPPVPGIELWFKKPADWAANVNIYYWEAAPAAGVDWPGVAMEPLAGDWYYLQMPLNVAAANLIFNDGSGKQTDNLYRAGSGCYVDAAWVDSCDVESVAPGIEVTFEAPGDWDQSFIYFWGTDNDPAWPGLPMEQIEGQWFSHQFEDGVSAVNIIFNNGAGTQTADQFRDSDGCYQFAEASWSDACVLPGLSFHFKAPASWAGDANIYFWEVEGVDAPAWPGVAMASLGDSWFFYQFPEGVRGNANIIFNDGSGAQTENLSRDSSGCYDGETLIWSDTCVMP